MRTGYALLSVVVIAVCPLSSHVLFSYTILSTLHSHFFLHSLCIHTVFLLSHSETWNLVH